MSVLSRLFAPSWGPGSAGGIATWGWGSTYSGKTVNVQTALGLVPVYNAVTQIAGGIATLPLCVYERDPLDPRYSLQAESDHAWTLLHDQPNPEMAADELWEIVASHVELWGNAFLWKRPDPDFTALTGQLWPLAPERVAVSREQDGSRAFWIEGEKFTEDTILHIRNLSVDGLVGYSPIQLARNAIATARAQEEFQGKFLRTGGKPAVLLKHPNTLKPDAQRSLKASWDNAKDGGTVVLEEGITVEKWTMPLEDAQFVQQMEFSDKRIAQMFNLDPSRLGAKSGDSLTYATTESENQRFVTYTLGRRMTRIENSVGRDRSIITPGKFAAFDADALQRAAFKERWEGYERGAKAGLLDADDVRPKENLRRRDDLKPVSAPEDPPSAPAPTE